MKPMWASENANQIHKTDICLLFSKSERGRKMIQLKATFSHKGNMAGKQKPFRMLNGVNSSSTSHHFSSSSHTTNARQYRIAKEEAEEEDMKHGKKK